MKVYLVDNYGVAFKNKEDAVAFVREQEYNEKKLAHYKRAFNANYSEKTIAELINGKITEIELR
jgi:hypothetical protein